MKNFMERYIDVNYDDIDHAWEVLKDAVEEACLGRLIPKMEEKFSDIRVGELGGDVTNGLIAEIFRIGTVVIEDELAQYAPEISLYVNGHDSRFEIKDEELYALASTSGQDVGLILWLSENGIRADDIEHALEDERLAERLFDAWNSGGKLSEVDILKILCHENKAVYEYLLEGDYYNTRNAIGPKDSDDIGGMLEYTLHLLIDSGMEDKVGWIMGAEKDIYEEDEDDYTIYVDLGYTIGGPILRWE